MSFLATDPTPAAFSDLLAVISTGATTDNLISDAAAFSIAGWRAGDMKTRTEDVLRKFSAALASMSNEQAREAALRFLNSLALPELKETWPNVWRGLVTQLNAAVAEGVRFLEPVCRVLEGKDRTLLDALPPEQREFALEVLAKFEPKAEPNL
jgi:hypothetical protein